MKPIRYFPVILILTFITASIGYYINYNNNQNYENQKKELLTRFKTNYESVLHGQEKAAKLFYNQIITSDKILSILKQVPKSYGEQKDQLRNQLLSELEVNYTKLKQFGFRQLHFHLPTGESFLRFHKPEKYGDNLFPVRYSVEKANKSLTMTQGFEEGRIFNGYRFVFPIIEGENHFGSVEISLSFLAISNALKEIDKINTSILFKKELIDQKLFESEKSNYEICEPINAYVYDKAISTNPNEKLSYALFKEIIAQNKNTIEKILKHKYATIYNLTYKNDNYIFVNIPIPNVKGNQIGSIFIFYQSDQLLKIQNKIYGKISIVLIFYIIMLIIVIIVIRRDRKITIERESNKKSKEILSESDEIKSKLFEIVTHDLRNHFNAVNGFLNLLNKRIDLSDPKINKLYHGLNDAVELTNNLMDNLFVWSRFQINKIDLQRSTFEGSSWIKKELTRFETIIKRKEITLINNTKGPVYYNADMDMMKYIHQNILLNAIRYSNKKGKILVEIIDTGKKTNLIIKDEGRGMSSSEVSKIMNQDKWSGSKIKTEIGLGLLVTRKLVDIQNGKIQIESAKGVGTTVTIEIPK
jgi:signal transduction histidine kinase